ncbi:bifunctional metallophosphatase/5'-nucleotidase [Vagococcus sp. BWB3-3]|uniref:Bifunctional metallophosphatase/5'-nucleotidase n=1 Tax=Vagococcus allomyrinae TaxID=2794353 RepID=A0A940PFW9_9ENTE|nr:bifunctional UDP-sugar hydrolase/5'-nucleotidase [Vagococcus allomyrinae]MBP1043203.1 bifunctional metallophosphatase/5'-nucleotidase [Vagococcus allomyrinae]
MEEIIILHTNDLHSHFEKWPRIRRYLLTEKDRLEELGKTVITLDLGDFSDRVHPLTEATDGKANTVLMNQVHYDLVTIGNNEGIGNSHEQLNRLYDEANFNVLLANVKAAGGSQFPSWASPSQIMTSKDGTKIGFMALTAPFPLTYNPNGWDVFEVDEVLPGLLKDLSSRSDVLVLMSHLGIEEETRIAQTYPEIDVILGSHTHHLFVDGMLVGTTLLAAAGKFGRYVGKVTLELDNHQLVDKKASVQVTKELPEYREDLDEIDGYLAEGQRLLHAQVVGQLPRELSADPRVPNGLLDFALKAIAHYGQVDAAILNSGLFLETLKAGRVTKDDLHRCLPHPMHLVKVTLTGEDLTSLVAELRREKDALRDFPIVGMGFRGKIFGELRSLGLSWEDRSQPIRWQGLPLEKRQHYSFVTVDHLMFIPFFPTIREKGQIEMLFPDFLRHVIGDYLEEYYPCH